MEETVKKVSKISIIREMLANGVTDVTELSTKSGAAIGTVRVQKCKFNKENK